MTEECSLLQMQLSFLANLYAKVVYKHVLELTRKCDMESFLLFNWKNYLK